MSKREKKEKKCSNCWFASRRNITGRVSPSKQVLRPHSTFLTCDLMVDEGNVSVRDFTPLTDHNPCHLWRDAQKGPTPGVESLALYAEEMEESVPMGIGDDD